MRTLALLFAAFAILAGLLAFKTVFPMVNPAINVSFPGNLRPAFFIARLKPSRIWRLFSSSPRFATLEETHASYVTSLANATEADIEHIVAAEVLKVSFIRQMKTDRLTGFAKALTVAVLLFVLLLLGVPRKEHPDRTLPKLSCPDGNVSIQIDSKSSPVVQSSPNEGKQVP